MLLPFGDTTAPHRQDKVEYLAKVGIGYGAKQAASLTWPVSGWVPVILGPVYYIYYALILGPAHV